MSGRPRWRCLGLGSVVRTLNEGRGRTFTVLLHVFPENCIYSTRSLRYLGDILAQIKILATAHTIDKFKRIVLAKHGKLQLSAEGEEALKLYIKKYEGLLGSIIPPDLDPLKNICSIGRSKDHHNVLRELELLEAGEI